jgi:transposase
MVFVRKYNEPIDQFQARRRQAAIELFTGQPDLSHAEIARRIGVSRKTVSLWHSAYERGGDQALEVKRSGGRDRLTDQQKQLIRDKIIAGPRSCGFAESIWTQKLIARLIEEQTGVQYHPCYIRVLMASIEISSQKPILRAKQRNEQAITAFKDEVFPEIKKGP